jgi:uncharacterized membrane protein YobD (UPF0266 family)
MSWVLQRRNKVVRSTKGWILFMLVYVRRRVTEHFVGVIAVVIAEYVKRVNLSITDLILSAVICKRITNFNTKNIFYANRTLFFALCNR